MSKKSTSNTSNASKGGQNAPTPSTNPPPAPKGSGGVSIPSRDCAPLSDDEIKQLSPILRRMYILLSDGKEHTREELWLCLEDDHAPIQGIYAHLTRLRKLMAKIGYGVGGETVVYAVQPLKPQAASNGKR